MVLENYPGIIVLVFILWLFGFIFMANKVVQDILPIGHSGDLFMLFLGLFLSALAPIPILMLGGAIIGFITTMVYPSILILLQGLT